MPTAMHNFRTNADGSLVCRHRDLGCCEVCADAHGEIIAVEGQHYWVVDRYEREMLAMMGY
jgi:hypothetical protein